MNRIETLLLPVARLLAIARRPTAAPRVEVATGGSLPAWLLRLVVVGVLVGAVALVARSQAHWLVATLLLAGVAVRPDGFAPSLMAGGIGLALATTTQEPFHPRVFALVLAVHLAIELGALIGPLPLQGRVEVRLLARASTSFLAIQALAQILALLGAWASGQPPAMPWLPLIAAIALAVLAWTITAKLNEPG